ncbi:PASTA domain-containing protein [Streptomyces sp. NPDC059499]|uniref:PASTA domain-containing protein n=1 Tax=Streptomyces sp. NPDC059499 TaxID=3346852 RepID=UPI0036C2ADCA
MTQPPPPGYGYPGRPSPYGVPPYPYPPAPVSRWWQHPALIITTLIILPPAGIALAWMSRWSQAKKIIATVLAALWFLTPFLGDPPKDAKDDAKPKSVATSSPSPSTTPPPTPTPAAKAQMPAVVGVAYSEAKRAIEELVVRELKAISAYNDVDLPKNYANWIVCFQSPKAGTTLEPEHANPNVHLVAPGAKCPDAPSTNLRPTPTPTPTPDGNDSDGSTGSSSSGSSDGSDGGGSSVGTVTPGAYCSTTGATGVSKKGVVYTCKGPGQERWRR